MPFGKGELGKTSDLALVSLFRQMKYSTKGEKTRSITYSFFYFSKIEKTIRVFQLD